MVQVVFNTFLDGVELTSLPVYVYVNSTKDLVAKGQSPYTVELPPNITYLYWAYYIDGAGRYYQDGGTLTPSTPLTVQMNLRYMSRPSSNLTITVTPKDAGSYFQSSPSPRVGDDLYVTAYPVSGYQYSHMNRYGVQWTTANPGEFLELGLYEKIEVVFIQAVLQYSNVTIRVTGEGTTDPPIGNYPSTYLIGGELWVYATPSIGWVLDCMKRNGIMWTHDPNGEFLNLGATEDIEVIFTTTVPPTCSVDSDCPSGYHCVNGVCELITPPPSKTVAKIVAGITIVVGVIGAIFYFGRKK